MKKLKCALAAILIGLTSCLFGACSSEEEQPSATVTQNTQTFITIVSEIQEPITVEDGLKIEVALLVYEKLNEAEKSNNDVSASKTILDGLKSKYDVVKAEADKQAEIARENKLVADFVAAVNELSLNKLKLEDEETVAALIEKHGQLKDESKSKSEVYAAYSKLLDAEDKIEELKAAARQEVIKATANKFINSVEELLKAIEEADAENKNQVILDAGDTIEDLYYDYDEFEDEVIDYEGVAEAKVKLDELNEEYVALKDAKDVEDFLKLIEELSPVGEKVTLQSEDTIAKAEKIYEKMSDEAKAAEGVAEYYVVLQQARAKYDELFAAAEAIRIQQFIEAANNVRTNIEDVDILWYDELDAASRAYYALAYESHSLPEVQQAYERWNAAQKAFNQKGYKQIPMSEPTLVYSGDVPPHIVLQNHANMLNSVVELYDLSSYTEISTYAKVWLYVYVDGNYIARGEVDTAKFIESGHIIPGSEVVKVLKELSAEHTEIKSGANFSFSMNFEDRENKYIPSNKTKVSESKVYNW
ncbi:MAG: hypothetical protein K2O28_05930 [Clostridia bacterium]|nr:hypothetical protein [Clostridia bacterium]